MADPKYATLPGIAYDQPDYYESEDVCETAPELLGHEQNDCVEKIVADVTESYGKFKGYWLSSQKTDFSGKIGSKHNVGYHSWDGPYELQASGEKESFIEKFNRLKCEIAELEQDLEQNSQRSKETGEANNLSFQISALQKQLLDIKVGDVGLCKSDTTKKNMFEDLGKVVKSTGDQESHSLTMSNEAKVVYQLQFKPQQIKLDIVSKEMEMLHRLDKIEYLLGVVPEKMNQLCAETGQKCIIDAVQSICSKVSLLDPNHLEQIESRLGALVQKLNSVASKQSSVAEDYDKTVMVKELYGVVKQLEPMIALLPLVVERLSSLKALHDGAMNFSQTLIHIENIQSNMDIQIQNQIQLLNDIQQGLSANKISIKEAVQKLEHKLHS